MPGAPQKLGYCRTCQKLFLPAFGLPTVPACPACGRPTLTISLAGPPVPPRRDQAPGAPQEIGSRFGRYLRLDEIGRGGVGAVDRAFDTVLERAVALKVLLKDQDQLTPIQIQRFLREARITSQISHPHIVPVYDVGEVDVHSYFSMGYIDGITLRDAIIARRELLAAAIPAEAPAPPLTLRQGLTVLRDVASALGFAHSRERQIVHRDVKPGNILIDKAGHGFLVDFGIVKEVKAQEQGSLTGSGALMGSPLYMSPEHVKSAKGAGVTVVPPSDVFSLGIVLYEFLTTLRPFEGNSLEVVLNRIVGTNPPPPSQALTSILRGKDLGNHAVEFDLPLDIDRVVMKALEKDCEARYPSGQALADGIDGILHPVTLPSSALPPAVGAPGPVEPPEPHPVMVEPTTQALMTRLVDGCRIFEEIGRGATGVVFHGITNVSQHVAVKFLRVGLARDPELRKVFKREARALAKVRHPNLITLYHFYDPPPTEDVPPCMFLEYMEGGSLEELLRGEGVLQPARASKILLSIAEGIHHLHVKGIVHGDIKPSNVLFGEGMEVVKVADFGIAASLRAVRDDIPRGTPGYMVPDALLGSTTPVQRDIYALGVTFHRMLMGKMPEAGPASPAASKAPSPGELYLNIARRMTVSSPSPPYEDMAQVIADLREVLAAGQGATQRQARATPAIPTPTPPPPPAPVETAPPAPEPARVPSTPPPADRPTPTPKGPGRSRTRLGLKRAAEAEQLPPVEARYRLLCREALALSADCRWQDALDRLVEASKLAPEREDAKAARVQMERVSATGLAFSGIASGEFTMGTDSGPADCGPPQVVLVDSFLISRTVVTNQSYEAFDPSHPRERLSPADDCPVTGVSHYDAVAFCKWLSGPCGTFRLPTEAEWEKAARGPNGWAYPWGDEFVKGQGNTGADIEAGARPCGSYPANPYGLHDTCGNVWEWCADFYDPQAYWGRPARCPNPRVDAPPPDGARVRVLRGGAWDSSPKECACWFRAPGSPEEAAPSIGFRVVFVPALARMERDAGGMDWIDSRRSAILDLSRLGSLSELASKGPPALAAWGSPETAPAPFAPLVRRVIECARLAREFVEARNLYERNRSAVTLSLELDALERSAGSVVDRRADVFASLAAAWKILAEGWTSKQPAPAEGGAVLSNPYVYGSPLGPEHRSLFKGRQEPILAIRQALGNLMQRPQILLSGPRHAGKSSLVRQLPQVLGEPWVVVRIDLAAPSLREGMPSLIEAIAFDVHLALAGRGIQVEPLPFEEIVDSPFLSLDGWCEDLRQTLPETLSVLLCLDGLEHVMTLVQKEDYPLEILDVFRRLDRFTPALAVLYTAQPSTGRTDNRLAQLLSGLHRVELGHLGAQEATELVLRPVEGFPLTWTPGQCETLRKWTDGHPYLLQALCYHLVERLVREGRREVGDEDLRRALEAADGPIANHFLVIWKEWEAPLRRAARRLAGTGHATIPQLAGETRLKEGKALPILDRLLEEQLVEREGELLRIRVPLFRTWLCERSGE